MTAIAAFSLEGWTSVFEEDDVAVATSYGQPCHSSVGRSLSKSRSESGELAN